MIKENGKAIIEEKDIIALKQLYKFDCKGLSCYNCPYNDYGDCLLNMIHEKFENWKYKSIIKKGKNKHDNI